jgi:peptidyl-tRNA hydrolase
MSEQPKDHRLYILMRTDMASMNPGKACAQAAHAANKFAHTMKTHKCTKEHELAYYEWCESSGTRLDEPSFQAFGTTITLSCDETLLHQIVGVAKENGLPSGIVFDPTYPLRDGDYTHYIPLDTCGYVFVSEHLTNQTPELMKTLDLM